MNCKKIISGLLFVCMCINILPIVYASDTQLRNVALNKPVTSGAYHASYPKTMLNDGIKAAPNFVIGGGLTDNADGVASVATENWWIIDLENLYEVEKLILYSDTELNNSETYFKISASADGETYDALFETSGSVRTPLPLQLSIENMQYRYIKLEKTGGNGRYYYNELEVYSSTPDEPGDDGPPLQPPQEGDEPPAQPPQEDDDDVLETENIAVGKNITSGNYSSAYNKTNLNDGNTDNFVLAGGDMTDNEDGTVSPGTENWWIIDLSKVYEVQSIKLHSATELNNSETYFKISASADGIMYETLFETAGSARTPLPLELDVKGVPYQYVKLEKTGGNGRYYYHEFEVYVNKPRDIMTEVTNPAYDIDFENGTVTLSSVAEYEKGVEVTADILKHGFKWADIDSGKATVDEALLHHMQVNTKYHGFEFPAYSVPEDVFGELDVRLKMNDTYKDISFIYISAKSLTYILGAKNTDNAKAFVELAKNFSESIGFAVSDYNRFEGYTEEEQLYFAENYMLGKNYGSLPYSELAQKFGDELTAFANDRKDAAKDSFNNAQSPEQIQECLLKYNDVFGVDYTDEDWFAGLSEDSKSEFFKRMDMLTITDVTQVATDAKKQIALRKIEIGPWGKISGYLNEYKDLLGLDLTNFNKNVTKLSKSLVGVFTVNPTEIQELLDKKEQSHSSGTAGSGRGGGGGSTGGVNYNVRVEVPADQEPVSAEKTVFNDLDLVPWAKEKIIELYNKNIVSGKTANEFKPGDNITRAEFVKLLVSMANFKSDKEICFADVNDSHWAKPYISAAAQNGIVTGFDGEFKPEAFITRQDMAVMLYRTVLKLSSLDKTETAAFSDESEIAQYAKEAVNVLCANKVISGMGNGSFCPLNNATRAESAVLIYNALKYFNK